MPLSTQTLTQAWQSRGMLACALWPISLWMAALVWLRRKAYGLGWLASTHLPVPTLVVGNRIVGGAGKTPTTIAVLQHLQAQGWRPGVLSRGYKAKAPQTGPVLLDAQTEATLNAEQTGDEPWLLWRRTRVPIMVGRDRVAGGQALLKAHPELNILVCDDGLQHLRLQRDLELIVFDERGAGNGWLLPAGPLREHWDSAPTPGLRAPPLVLYNAAKASTPLPGHVSQRGLAAPVRLTDWWLGLDTPAPQHRPQPSRAEPIWALAGIAQPQRFFDALAHIGWQVHPLPLADHAHFDTLPWPLSVRELIVTEKDAVKLDPQRVARERPHTQVWVAGLDFQPEAAFWTALNAALATLPPPPG